MESWSAQSSFESENKEREGTNPVPGLGVDGLSDGSDDSQTLEGVILDEVLTESSKETNGGRSSVAIRKKKGEESAKEGGKRAREECEVDESGK